MITIKMSDGQCLDIYGLSTDVKPLDAPNASQFHEMDTSTRYLFDEENEQWLAFSRGSGGGGGSHPSGDLATKLLTRTISGPYQNNDLEKLGMYALSYCTGLTSLRLDSCQSVENGACRGSDNLTSVTLPATELIGSYSFAGCYDLASATIGGGSIVTTIESNAFVNCVSLSEVYLPSDHLCVLQSITAFDNTPITSNSYTGSYGKIYVPQSLLSAYRSATNWSYLAARFEAIS